MKNKRKWFLRATGAFLGLLLALLLFGVFYGVMAYQLADGGEQRLRAGDEDALLALPGAQLLAEQTQAQKMGGEICTVTTRLYRTDAGLEIEVISAAPAAYIERLSEEKWTPQPVTGFVLAGLDAVYSVREAEGIVSARDGSRVYMLRAAAEEQTLYALGTAAVLE